MPIIKELVVLSTIFVQALLVVTASVRTQKSTSAQLGMDLLLVRLSLRRMAHE
jgi:hypothetical protein